MTCHATPLFAKYEIPTIKAASGSEKNTVFHCLLQKCPASRAAGMTSPFSTPPYFNNTYLIMRTGFLYSEENTIDNENKKVSKHFCLEKLKW